MSGYRDNFQSLKITTNYSSVYRKYMGTKELKSIKNHDVDLIITLDNIVTVSYFDIKMYKAFNRRNKP